MGGAVADTAKLIGQVGQAGLLAHGSQYGGTGGGEAVLRGEGALGVAEEEFDVPEFGEEDLD